MGEGYVLADSKVYLAGPMRGYPRFNFDAFAEAASVLREQYEADVWSPAEHDLEYGFNPDEDTALPLSAYMKYDLPKVCESDCVVVLPGWEASEGATLEVLVAHRLNKPVWQYPDLARVDEANISGAVTGGVVQAGEVRVTNPKTGGQKGSKLARHDLIPPWFVTALAEHYGKGAQKYEDRNWEKGYDWGLSYAAAQRHLSAFWGGEDFDPETGTHHVIAAAWHCACLYTFCLFHPYLDDRSKLP